MPSLDLRTLDYGWVLGTGRCGSTLVHEVLARHPAVGFLSNVEDRLSWSSSTGRWNGPAFRLVPDRLTEKGRLRYAPSEGYRLLEREVSPMLSEPVRDLTAADVTPWLADRFRDVFDRRARSQGCAVFVHKFTGWPRAGFVDAIIPNSRFVHIVRDGRAVANSWLQMDWWRGHRGPGEWHFGPLPDAYRAEWEESGRSFVLLAGLGWKILMDAFDAARRELPPEHWLEVRYEDVLADPAGSFATMLDFLNLPGHPDFERALARYEFRPGRADAFRRDLDPKGLRLLDASLAQHLARFGYAGADTHSRAG